ncbi:MAG: 6-carboxytetrahydropterin synthase [Planctomycetota bacterium]
MNARYTVTVETRFSATHQLRLADGAVEPRHGHDWLVQATFAQSGLDRVGMVVDFHQAEALLKTIVAPFHHGDLNSQSALEGRNPTAEVVAKYVFDRLGEGSLPCVLRVCITEAPDCKACYEAE